MAHDQATPRRKPVPGDSSALDEKLKAEGRYGSVATVPETPIEPPPHDFPAREGTAVPPPQAGYDDAPPSYEDAIASDLPPVNAPRPEYAPPAAGEDTVLRGDEKKRRDS
jgi:hypothetical protein